MTVMVFDIETIPDIQSGRLLQELPDTLDDKSIVAKMLEHRLEKTQGASSFLPHYLHQIVTISVVVANQDWVKVWSLGDESSTEAELIQRFYEGIQRYSPQLISWNGCGFDLPVLHYRSLLHGISAPRYWELGERDNDFKWNNYLSRYHQRHLDLMDVLASYNNRAFAPLDEIAVMLGFPGKMNMDGSQVYEKFAAQDLTSIRNYCEIDVLNTYLIYLRFQKIRGHLSAEAYDLSNTKLQAYLDSQQKQHFIHFLNVWTNRNS